MTRQYQESEQGSNSHHDDIAKFNKTQQKDLSVKIDGK